MGAPATELEGTSVVSLLALSFHDPMHWRKKDKLAGQRGLSSTCSRAGRGKASRPRQGFTVLRWLGTRLHGHGRAE